ncbi:MAG: helix-turn-helix transcriptional regulator [Acidithiobacillus sp.]|uniref:helix-turn-helix transcriptional regulator n=1 Tax=Acidithiobacillus sp. TaxID=1872118 RepID=UPI003D049AC1
MNDETLPRLLTKADLCDQLTISPRTLENMVKAGDFPPPVRIGKHVYWSQKAVTAWQQRLFSAQESWALS